MNSMKAKLVIADDEADIRRLIVFLLRSYDLFEAQNGKRALELICEVQPDLALLDVMMPEMTGLEVLTAMGENPLIASTPVIMLSAKGQADEIEQGLQSGATRYLVKPFESQALRTCIAEVLRESAPSPVKE
ncbi:MAG TPA: response regulator [Ktedonobacteraceae bacterium]|nr:response regulator [Ktedonobacteraceae bacterium]